MKKVFKFLLVLLIIFFISLSVYKYKDGFRIKVFRNSLSFSVVTRSISNGTSIAIDENKNLYVAYDNNIKVIDKEGTERVIIKDLKDNIEDIKYKDNLIYLISGQELYEYSMEDKTLNVIQSSIPKGGNNIPRKLCLYEDKLLLAIGSSTNAGINEKGQVEKIAVNTDELLNGGLYEIEGEKVKIFAGGIRGITGIDVNSKGEVVGIFSGINKDDSRNINRDTEYIYNILKGEWYGFPDFSGGNYITSPRFMGDKIVEPLIDKPWKKIVLGPIIEAEKLNSLREIAIDKEGIVLEKDSIIYFNNDKKTLSILTDNMGNMDIGKLLDKSYVTDIIYNNNGFYILDSGASSVYLLEKNQKIDGFFLENIVWILIGVLIIIILSILFVKRGDNKNEKNISS